MYNENKLILVRILEIQEQGQHWCVSKKDVHHIIMVGMNEGGRLGDSEVSMPQRVNLFTGTS